MDFLRDVLDIVFAQPNGPRAQATRPTCATKRSATLGPNFVANETATSMAATENAPRRPAQKRR